MTMIDLQCPSCSERFGFNAGERKPATVLCPRCRAAVPLGEVHQDLATARLVMKQLPISKRLHRWMYDKELTHAEASRLCGIDADRLKQFRLGQIPLEHHELDAIATMMAKVG